METEYYQRTGIFPAMHTAVIKAQVYHGLYDTDAVYLTLPFLIDHVEEERLVFGEDYLS